MIRRLVVVNAPPTVSFGVAALYDPVPLFGVSRDADGARVARGDAATAIGCGVILGGLGNAREPAVATPLPAGLLLFNAIETGVQAAAATAGVATGAIEMNTALHAGVATGILGAFAARRHTADSPP